jgi:hypothetical protein
VLTTTLFFQAERSHLFDLLKPSACCGTTFGGRKNIKRWTSNEAKKLVEGVWIFGVGNWTTVKRVYFKTSFRRPVDLKVMILDRLVTDCTHDHIYVLNVTLADFHLNKFAG